MERSADGKWNKIFSLQFTGFWRFSPDCTVWFFRFGLKDLFPLHTLDIKVDFNRSK